MNHLCTFSGIGGWAIAARWMGWEHLGFVEKEPFCQKVLAKNFPGVPIYDDIFNFSAEPFRGHVDILTGSTPCQPFSAAGKRQGSNDERHLFPEFLRVVAECQPRWVVIENVYGLLNIESGRVFEEYHTSLESEGYTVQTICIPASALNAPHRRDRLWIIAHANGERERAGHREIQGTDGEISERYDDAESRDADQQCDVTNTEYERPSSREHGRQSRFEKGVFESDQFDSQSDAADADHAGSRASASEPNAKRRPLGTERQQPQPESDGHDSDVANTRREYGTWNGKEMDADATEWTAGDVHAERCDSESKDSNGDDRHTESTGQPSGIDRPRQGEYGRTGAGSTWGNEHWITAATRFCGVDDGISDELDIVGSRDNRAARIKALGNAVVPAVVYEIFKAIQEADENLP